MYIYICIHAYIDIYIHTYTYTYIYAWINIYVHTYICTYTYSRMAADLTLDKNLFLLPFSRVLGRCLPDVVGRRLPDVVHPP